MRECQNSRVMMSFCNLSVLLVKKSCALNPINYQIWRESIRECKNESVTEFPEWVPLFVDVESGNLFSIFLASLSLPLFLSLSPLSVFFCLSLLYAWVCVCLVCACVFVCVCLRVLCTCARVCICVSDIWILPARPVWRQGNMCV